MVFNWFKKKNGTGQQQPEQTDTQDAASRQDTDPAPQEIPQEQPADPAPAKPARTAFFQRLRKGLEKTRKVLTTDIDDLFLGKKKIDDDLLEDLEELLITSDIGVQTAVGIIESISKKGREVEGADQLKAALKKELIAMMEVTDTPGGHPPEPAAEGGKPHVIMVVGVNGVGKTTTIGKLAARYTAEGKKVLIAAADTFRAAAIDQLMIWADRAGAEIVKHKENADPSAVVFDSIEAAIARGVDIIIIDTAGRLHTKVNLMEELKKIKRTAARKIPDAPHEVLLVLDATTGQNAVSQTELFNDAIGVTGLVLTKLDGTAKGGIVISICRNHRVPLKFIGIGEQIDDLQPFDPLKFVDALF